MQFGAEPLSFPDIRPNHESHITIYNVSFEDTRYSILFRKKTINFVYFYSYVFYELNSIDTHHIIHSSLLATICIIFDI